MKRNLGLAIVGAAFMSAVVATSCAAQGTSVGTSIGTETGTSVATQPGTRIDTTVGRGRGPIEDRNEQPRTDGDERRILHEEGLPSNCDSYRNLAVLPLDCR